jgi:Pectate lyase superfamily protein
MYRRGVLRTMGAMIAGAAPAKAAAQPADAGQTERPRTLTRISSSNTNNSSNPNVINVREFSGVDANDSNHDSTRAGIDAAIVSCNAASNPSNIVLYFPPGRYGIDRALTPANGSYSIIMNTGATIWDHGAKNEVVWRIGDPGAQADGHGIVRFELAMEGRGANNYANADNVAFEIVNVKHYSAFIRQAQKFVTGLRLVADGSGAHHHHYDASIQLGYLHNTRRSVALVTQNGNGAWMNNIRFQGGDFSPAVGTQPGGELSARYISALAFEGECKAVFHDPLCDGNRFTALYSSRGTVAVDGGHMEAPDWLIQHAPGVAVAGDEPCTWIAPRLEDRQFLIDDPDDVGSYAHDPFWGVVPTARPRELISSRDLTIGDIRASRMLYTADEARRLTVVELTGNRQPPAMSAVSLQRRGSGALSVSAGRNVSLLVPTGKAAALRARGSVAALQIIDTTGGAQIWSLSGDLQDA